MCIFYFNCMFIEALWAPVWIPHNKTYNKSVNFPSKMEKERIKHFFFFSENSPTSQIN